MEPETTSSRDGEAGLVPMWVAQAIGVGLIATALAVPWVLWGLGCIQFEEVLVMPETTGPGTSGPETSSGSTSGPETTGPETTGPETSSASGPETTGPPIPTPLEVCDKPGKRFAAKTRQRPALVCIPAGTFSMGSPASEEERDDDEARHRVTVDAFVMCNTEVTQAQYRAVMGTNPSDCGDEGKGCAGDIAVNQVSWNDACKYMAKLTELENKTREGESALTQCYERRGESWEWTDRACTGFRLPTEAEWERAARAGTSTAYFFKDTTKLGEYAWFGEGASPHAHPVAKKKRNPWGLFDIYGNVWEWCWDWYGTYKLSGNNNGSGPNNGVDRVLRGGAFWYGPGNLRSADRLWIRPTNRNRGLGFRCVRAPRPS